MKLYQNYLKEYENGLAGYSAIAVIGQSCLGSVAVMYLLMNGISTSETIQLFLVTIVCMFYNAAIISQQKAKTSFNLLIISVLTSLLIFVINIV